MIPTLNEERSLGKVIDTIPMKEFHERGFLGQMWQRLSMITPGGGLSLRKIYVQDGMGKGAGVRRHSPEPSARGGSKALSGRKAVMICMCSPRSSSQHFLMWRRTYRKYLVDLVDALEKGKDVVMGSRFRGDIKAGAMSRLNYLGNLALSATASILYMHPCSDVCTGLWGFRLDAIRAMDLDSDKFDLEAEMYAVSVRNHLKISEIPIDYYPREGDSKLVPINSGTMIFQKLLQRRFISANVERFSAT
jgi:dolichol-phosphate mannosyltransferase